MNKTDIQKNIHDLEYQYLLNVQNIFLGFIGATIITAIFFPNFPDTWPSKENIIFLLVFIAILFFFYFREELKGKIEDIKEINLTIPTQRA